MALSQPLITGHSDEFALLRRHESEKMFGVQLAGGYANRMVPAAEMIAREFGDGVDFVDVNLVSRGATMSTIDYSGPHSCLSDPLCYRLSLACGRVSLFELEIRSHAGDHGQSVAIILSASPLIVHPATLS
jgi:hypothetical protein